MFLETSALTGENVEETFLKCSRTILTKIEAGKINSVKLNNLSNIAILVSITGLVEYHPKWGWIFTSQTSDVQQTQLTLNDRKQAPNSWFV